MREKANPGQFVAALVEFDCSHSQISRFLHTGGICVTIRDARLALDAEVLRARARVAVSLPPCEAAMREFESKSTDARGFFTRLKHARFGLGAAAAAELDGFSQAAAESVGAPLVRLRQFRTLAAADEHINDASTTGGETGRRVHAFIAAAEAERRSAIDALDQILARADKANHDLVDEKLDPPDFYEDVLPLLIPDNVALEGVDGDRPGRLVSTPTKAGAKGATREMRCEGCWPSTASAVAPQLERVNAFLGAMADWKFLKGGGALEELEEEELEAEDELAPLDAQMEIALSEAFSGAILDVASAAPVAGGGGGGDLNIVDDAHTARQLIEAHELQQAILVRALEDERRRKRSDLELRLAERRTTKKQALAASPTAANAQATALLELEAADQVELSALEQRLEGQDASLLEKVCQQHEHAIEALEAAQAQRVAQARRQRDLEAMLSRKAGDMLRQFDEKLAGELDAKRKTLNDARATREAKRASELELELHEAEAVTKREVLGQRLARDRLDALDVDRARAASEDADLYAAQALRREHDRAAAELMARHHAEAEAKREELRERLRARRDAKERLVIDHGGGPVLSVEDEAELAAEEEAELAQLENLVTMQVRKAEEMEMAAIEEKIRDDAEAARKLLDEQAARTKREREEFGAEAEEKRQKLNERLDARRRAQQKIIEDAEADTGARVAALEELIEIEHAAAAEMTQLGEELAQETARLVEANVAMAEQETADEVSTPSGLRTYVNSKIRPPPPPSLSHPSGRTTGAGGDRPQAKECDAAALAQRAPGSRQDASHALGQLPIRHDTGRRTRARQVYIRARGDGVADVRRR